MSVVSFSFIIFLAVSMMLYYIVPRKYQWISLLAISLYFINSASGIEMLAVFLLLVFINWAGALCIERYSASNNSFKKKCAYVITVTVDVMALLFLKDINFFKRMANGVSEIIGKPLGLPDITVLAPIGISYFTLVLIGYVTDVLWEKFEPEKDLLKFMLFVGFFPQMSSGPFVRYDHTGRMLYAGRKFEYERFVLGTERIIWGFFKKLVVAERLSVIVNTIYGNHVAYKGWYIIIAAAAFTIQLYADFSGAIDIALGTAECFGVYLPENFNGAFFSTSIAEFWRRWHITLGDWFREYVFNPILRSGMLRKLKKWCRTHIGKRYEKKFDLPVYLALMIVWTLNGFWHGGAGNYIFAGMLFGINIVFAEMFSGIFKYIIKKLHINVTCFSWRLFQQLRTFCIFAFASSFFRASNLREGFEIWKSAFAVNNIWILFDQSIYKLGLDRQDFGVMAVSVAFLFLVDIWKQKCSIRQKLAEQNYLFRLGVILTGIFVVLIFGMYGPGYNVTDFIYQQF